MTRRTLIGTLAAAASAAAAKRTPKPEWKPRLGVLGRYTPNNVEFAKTQGFTNMILNSPNVNASDQDVEQMRSVLRQNEMNVSALEVFQNHIAPDLTKRAAENAHFVKAIEMAGKLGVPYVATASGKDDTKPFAQQIDETVRVYTEKYFPACEQNHVRILWEPYPESPNLATSPVGFDALFKAFGPSPYVGLQYDPSHLVRQFMDPIQTAWDFADKIYDVHLKDTEIFPQLLKSGGINPVNGQRWWTYRIPGSGSIKWSEFFSALEANGYQGAMSIEQEDPFYGADDNPGPDFSEPFKVGFIMAKRYLNQYVP